MGCLKHVLIAGLLLAGLTAPVLLNGRFNCDLLCSGLAYGQMPNQALSHTAVPDILLLYFEHQAPVREINGQVSQQFRLIFKGGDPDMATVCFTEDRNSATYRADIKDGKVIIRAHRPTVFRLWAVFRKGKNIFVAHTCCILFGDSEIEAERVNFIAQTHAVPYIEMLPSRQSYWPQTGQEFIFSITAVTGIQTSAISESMMASSNNRVFSLKPDNASRYAYAPAHDRHLMQTSIRAGRNDIIFTHIKRKDQSFNLTHTLYVHRSRTAFDKHAVGAAVFSISFVFFFGWIIIHRKRNTPW